MRAASALCCALSAQLAIAASPLKLEPGLWRLDVTGGDMQSAGSMFCEKDPLPVTEMAAKVIGLPLKQAGTECAMAGAVEAPGITRISCRIGDGAKMDAVFFWQQLQPREWSAGSVVRLRPANQEVGVQQLRLRRLGECK
ncbi:hypothetical protein [Chromobacterium sp. IIBBL 290-4]|uniref:DUF3617 domain-containing protein n=1 Tax=Chromobacterium sp. IIBBL 290-4 TaxID=2953890 RepID=UPI0020B8AF8F|nr:hypothetical protein [Chromobacterium sp. IIBBL 290-4]UTH76332.1 hypothetical protein NKT35_09595 [Chromobacterium sp. IIBBL 290-4]